MAIRQYIGARYVTKIYENSLDPSSAEWEQANYEPLTMVTYMNGSYLSKKDVPASVGNPADNPSYWVQTGFYNGQIASLQQQIEDMKDGDVAGSLQNQIDDLDTNIGDLDDLQTTDKTSVVNAINELVNSVPDRKRKFMLWGDSYMRGVDGDDNQHTVTGGGWGTRFQTLMADYDIDVVMPTGSSGFNVNNNRTVDAFDTYVATLTDDEKAEFTDVVFIGGWNDQWVTTGLTNSVREFVQHVKTALPQAEVKIAPMTCNPQQGTSLLGYYIYGAKDGAYVSSELINVLAKKSLTGTDDIHPTAAGYATIQPFINEFILTGRTSYRYTMTTSYTDGTDTIQMSVHATEKMFMAAPTGTNRGGHMFTKSSTDLNKNYVASGDYIQCGILNSQQGCAKLFDSTGLFKNIFGLYFTAVDTLTSYATYTCVSGDKVLVDNPIIYLHSLSPTTI